METFLAQLGVDPWIWLVVGGLLAVVGVLKIIGQGISLALWVVLVVLGVSLTNFGLRQGGVDLPPGYADKLSEILGPGKEMTEQTVKNFCLELLDEPEGTPAWCKKTRAKPKGDWTANELAIYARKCLDGSERSTAM